nr:histidine kinase [Streptomyces aidingensis]
MPRPVPLPRLLPHALAFAATAALLPVTIIVLDRPDRLDGGLAGLLGILQAGPLLFAAARPRQVWYVVLAADTATALALLAADDRTLSWPWPPMTVVGYLLLCAALSLTENRRTLITVFAATAAVSLVLGLLAPERSSGSHVVLTVLAGVVLTLGGSLRALMLTRRRLAEQETISESERARRTLLEERARIARELHDVVAHHMSVITVQADSAPYRLAGLPPEAREEFAAIAASARHSLGEMRRLLGVLRSEQNGGERTPQPGLADLPGLVDATRRAGIPTELRLPAVAGEGPEAPPVPAVPQAVGLSAYRIVQEALANVVRHAPGAPTTVTLGIEGDALDVTVRNGPSPGPASGGPAVEAGAAGTGHGLVGMRERVRLVGGTLETGPLPDGGFRVTATLPL